MNSRALRDENAVRGRRTLKDSQVAPLKTAATLKVIPRVDENVELPSKNPSEKNETCERTSETADATPALQSGEIEDIDAGDGEFLEFCSGYVKKIYNHLFESETRHPVLVDYLKRHPALRPHMRKILIEWLVSLQLRYKLLQDTLLLAISLLDRFMSVTKVEVDRANYQLVGATCLWVASKYEEMFHPSIDDLVYVCAGAYKQIDLQAMEVRILTDLGFEFSKPLISHFLRRFSKAGGGDLRVHVASKYLIELTLYNYGLSSYVPSLIAASTLFVARKVVAREGWNATLEFYSRHKLGALRPVAVEIAKMAMNARDDKHMKTTVRKYSVEKYYRVSLLFESADVLNDIDSELGHAEK